MPYHLLPIFPPNLPDLIKMLSRVTDDQMHHLAKRVFVPIALRNVVLPGVWHVLDYIQNVME